MTLYEIFTYLKMIPPSIMELGIVIIVLSIVEVTPTIKLNPWKWLRSFAELPKRLERLEHEFNDDRAFRWRSLIFSRARELEKSLKTGDLLRREWWDDSIETIGNYERYCEGNPNFKNELAVQTIAFFKNQYQYALENNLFL